MRLLSPRSLKGARARRNQVEEDGEDEQGQERRRQDAAYHDGGQGALDLGCDTGGDGHGDEPGGVGDGRACGIASAR